VSDIKDKLHELMARKGVMSGAQWQQKLDEMQRLRREGAFEIDRVVSGQIVGYDSGAFYLVRHNYPLSHRHGGVTLGGALRTQAEHVVFTSNDDEHAAFDPTTCVYMDTETTGISGGTGTVAFLVGVGYFEGDVFRLDQCFMRDFDDEEPMLRYLDEIFKRFETVITYNGKTFDVPLLRTRFIQNRMPFRLDSAMHFDLLHAARRIWKRRLRDCSLGSIERNVLGVVRDQDVPGMEIPQIWLDYIRSRDARKLDRVFSHHELDILSLVTLTAWLSQALDAANKETEFTHSEDRLSIIEIQYRKRRYPEVIDAARTLLNEDLTPETKCGVLELLGYACKRTRDFDQMQAIWEQSIVEYPSRLAPRIELAKHHEHRTRNLEEAKRLCEEVVPMLQARAQHPLAEASLIATTEALRVRLERINRKLTRGLTIEDVIEPDRDLEDRSELWESDLEAPESGAENADA
jgi:uncharacterized protein YprB with RNaseH-like and TPR domain